MSQSSPVTALTDEAVREGASANSSPVRRMALIDELARRALENDRLLAPAIDAISAERAIRPRGPALGWAGAGRLLDSDDDRVIRVFLRAVEQWSADEQRDLISLWAGNGALATGTATLVERYGFKPGYSVDLEKP